MKTLCQPSILKSKLEYSLIFPVRLQNSWSISHGTKLQKDDWQLLSYKTNDSRCPIQSSSIHKPCWGCQLCPICRLLNQIYKFILSDELSSSLRPLMMIIISPQGQDITGVTWMLCSVLPIQELEFGTSKLGLFWDIFNNYFIQLWNIYWYKEDWKISEQFT